MIRESSKQKYIHGFHTDGFVNVEYGYYKSGENADTYRSQK
jgi:hypothetical protein